jgi:rhodanese-related sulfurtransferase
MAASIPTGPGPAALSPREALERLRRGAVLVDIRGAYETNYRVPEVPAILHIPNQIFMERWYGIPRDAALIVMDNVGVRGKEIAAFLADEGYLDVAWIVGGIVDWVREGLPVLKDPNYELRGQCACKLRPVNPLEEPRWKS